MLGERVSWDTRPGESSSVVRRHGTRAAESGGDTGAMASGASGAAVIRAAQSADALEVAQLHVRSWQAAYRGLLPDDFLAGLDPARRAEYYGFDGDGSTAHTWVVEEHGRLHGFATIGPSQEGDGTELGELYGLYVDPASWRRGYGGLLIGQARELLAARGFAEAVLWVLRGNERAEAFYRADGWSRDGAERDDDIGPGWRAASTASCEIPVIHELRYRRQL
jgi:GNAT superfamily N-acetyltransferase